MTPIYLIDDDPGVRDGLTALLEAFGYPVVAYSDPEAFLAEHQSLPAGCLLLDLQMPQMSGATLLERLAAQGWHSPSIVLSAYPETPLAAQARVAGAQAVLAKPLDGATLQQCLAQVGCTVIALIDADGGSDRSTPPDQD